MIIHRCYDSHVHLMGTGSFLNGLNLKQIKSASDLKQINLVENYFRKDWLTAFGWDENHFDSSFNLNSHLLDKIFPQFPVIFYRNDGHAAWINAKTRQILERSLNKNLDNTEVIFDDLIIEIEKVIPKETKYQKEVFIKTAIKHFNNQGFTHVRDMGSDEEQFEILLNLDYQRNLSLYLDLNFPVFSLDELKHKLIFLEKTKEKIEKFEKENNRKSKLRIDGIKFFIDGALGSEGALLSQPYTGSAKNGIQAWSKSQIKEIITLTFEKKFAISVHSIGDLAADILLECLNDCKNKGYTGKVNIEHAEVMRAETIYGFSNLNTHFYMQPCHWLTDKKWLSQKLGDLYLNAFPWARVVKVGIPLNWGSDSPIENSSIKENYLALKESEDLGSIASPEIQFETAHSHPDEDWGGNCYSEFKDLKPEKIFFDGNFLNTKI